MQCCESLSLCVHYSLFNAHVHPCIKGKKTFQTNQMFRRSVEIASIYLEMNHNQGEENSGRKYSLTFVLKMDSHCSMELCNYTRYTFVKSVGNHKKTSKQPETAMHLARIYINTISIKKKSKFSLICVHEFIQSVF